MGPKSILARTITAGFLPLALGLCACRADPRVVISTNRGKQIVFHVEVADTPVKREMGLQYRSELADNRGMLFLFPGDEIQAFWMKNTPIPLDMIFIGSDRKIVGIIPQTTPFSTDSLSVARPSQFVLEIKGGLAQLNGIKEGDSVRFEEISVEGLTSKPDAP